MPVAPFFDLRMIAGKENQRDAPVDAAAGREVRGAGGVGGFFGVGSG